MGSWCEQNAVNGCSITTSYTTDQKHLLLDKSDSNLSPFLPWKYLKTGDEVCFCLFLVFWMCFCKNTEKLVQENLNKSALNIFIKLWTFLFNSNCQLLMPGKFSTIVSVHSDSSEIVIWNWKWIGQMDRQKEGRKGMGKERKTNFVSRTCMRQINLKE